MRLAKFGVRCGWSRALVALGRPFTSSRGRPFLGDRWTGGSTWALASAAAVGSGGMCILDACKLVLNSISGRYIFFSIVHFGFVCSNIYFSCLFSKSVLWYWFPEMQVPLLLSNFYDQNIFPRTSALGIINIYTPGSVAFLWYSFINVWYMLYFMLCVRLYYDVKLFISSI